jgi:hypothetical protein
MTPTAATNPRWTNAAHNSIDLDVAFEELGPDPIPFTATPGDTVHGRALFDAAASGEYGTVAEYVPPVPAPPPVPQSVSRQQIMTALMLAGLITEAEWLACYQSGTLPALVSAAIATLPTDAAKLVAKVKWVEFSEARRTDAMVALLAAQAGLTDVQVDDLFRTAAAL